MARPISESLVRIVPGVGLLLILVSARRLSPCPVTSHAYPAPRETRPQELWEAYRFVAPGARRSGRSGAGTASEGEPSAAAVEARPSGSDGLAQLLPMGLYFAFLALLAHPVLGLPRLLPLVPGTMRWGRGGPHPTQEEDQPSGPPSVAERRRLLDRIQRMRAEGMTPQAIADQLNLEGVPFVSMAPPPRERAIGFSPGRESRRVTTARAPQTPHLPVKD